MSGWDDATNAEKYSEFTDSYPMYRETSRDLVARAGIADANRVVDLCSGTGETTQALLELMQERARLIAIDRSEAMQRVARERITVPRVRWVQCAAESIDHQVQDQGDRGLDSPSLVELMVQVAEAEHDFVRPTDVRRRRLTITSVTEMLATAGLDARWEIVSYPRSVQQARAWLSVPVFGGMFRTLSYEQRLDVLAKAYDRVDKDQTMTGRWLLVTAIR
ncbi:methyltransferase domain-containing protein [Flexivirga alba]|uniref:Methyltransferase domain-containing protein n=1 Tax=Flexivirga alba TaxID=702742 RepID=A0ABW2ALH8_9MICO